MRSVASISPTTAQSLGALLKYARYTMRKGKGLDGDLIEEYADDGELQFTLPDVLRVSPVSDHGTPMEIVTIFGGPDKLRTAVAQLRILLYSA